MKIFKLKLAIKGYIGFEMFGIHVRVMLYGVQKFINFGEVKGKILTFDP